MAEKNSDRCSRQPRQTVSGSSGDGVRDRAAVDQLEVSDPEPPSLSACQRDYGAEQKVEGVSALSRGFLVAGSRRVVASNWLVDDEAAASQISVFCSAVAKSQASGKVDYAASLQATKRWVRQQDKWSSPYYLATFVLVGAEVGSRP